jgi:sulfate transport system substrate-binding protein
MGRGEVWAVLSITGLVVGAGVVGCAPSRGSEPGTDALTIGAFSVMREALHEGVLPAFADEWKRRTGRDLRFEESYNASGAQARAIASGFDADVAILSLESDLDALERAGLTLSGRTVVSQSLVVIGHRPGNPKGIRDWDDLARPGVAVVYPDPKTSGAARWNINAIYGSARLRSGPEAARARLAAIQANVVTMDASGRQSLATFERGTGDAIVTYENDLRLAARLTGRAAPYVTPSATLRIESPAAVIEQSVRRHANRAVAEAFLAFLVSPRGQAILVQYGFRPLDQPIPPGVFTMKDLGGWRSIKEELFDAGGVWDSLFTAPGSGGGG